jgi:hypothetical protein
MPEEVEALAQDLEDRAPWWEDYECNLYEGGDTGDSDAEVEVAGAAPRA